MCPGDIHRCAEDPHQPIDIGIIRSTQIRLGLGEYHQIGQGGYLGAMQPGAFGFPGVRDGIIGGIVIDAAQDEPHVAAIGRPEEPVDLVLDPTGIVGGAVHGLGPAAGALHSLKVGERIPWSTTTRRSRRDSSSAFSIVPPPRLYGEYRGTPVD